jgi:hypothetical protein
MFTIEGKADSAISTNPAANTEASITVPTGNRWVIIAARLTVVQGATQTPLPNLEIVDSAGNVVGFYPGASAAVTAGVTSTFDWAEGFTLTAGAGALTNRASIPRGLVVGPGWIVRTNTTGKGANTDLSALALHIIAL